LKKNLVFIISVVLLLTACASSDETYWGLSATFTHDNNTLFGTKEKFGIIKTNGESNEPEFPVGQGRQYRVYFLDDIKDLNGKKYKMMATHKDSNETVNLYENEIQNMQSDAKFGLNKDGLWKIDVLIDGDEFTSFIVEAR
jgi:major membrane immunogen (membrane-anchored lipoprotein)